jgi:hypothetical protein
MNTHKNVLFRYLLIDRRLREEPNAGIEDLKSYIVEHSKNTVNVNVLTTLSALGQSPILFLLIRLFFP